MMSRCGWWIWIIIRPADTPPAEEVAPSDAIPAGEDKTMSQIAIKLFLQLNTIETHVLKSENCKI